MTDSIDQLLLRVKSGEPIEFEETIAVIDENYRYTPTRFTNGLGEAQVVSEPGTNIGSLKIFSFASENCLTEAETLQLFGKFYREDVLHHPEGTDHMNIRTFMKSGWSGIQFDAQALLRAE